MLLKSTMLNQDIRKNIESTQTKLDIMNEHVMFFAEHAYLLPDIKLDGQRD